MGELYISFGLEIHGEKQNGKVAGEMGRIICIILSGK